LHHLPKPELLYLSGLFHDIAKGRGGNHAKLGAIDAETFCLEHGLSEDDARLVAWLVQEHLLMSMVAQRKDISDPEIVSSFARQVGSQTRLDYLYLLTMCDIRATNPKHWNSWKDNLLAELYHRTATTLRMGFENPVNRDMAVKENQTSTLRLLSQQGYDPEKIHQLWSHFTNDYFLHHSPYEARWHTELISDTRPSQLPLVEVRLSDRGRIEIFIYTEEHDDLFARVSATIDQLGLTIFDAQIMATDNGYTLDTFKVLEESGITQVSDYRLNEIKQHLRDCLSDTSDTCLSARPSPRVQKHFKVKTLVKFEQLPGKDITVMNIITGDRPGLLARIGRAFSEQKIRLHNAKISTAGEKANDTFHITDSKNQPLLDEDACQQLRATIIRNLTS
jgi:[protein-PII] uridylyltransferase